MDVSGTYYNPFQGFLTHSGAKGGLRGHILTKNWPFLTPPANSVQFFGLKMPYKCVPWIVLQVLCSTRTSRGSLRPPKRPPKARNGQNITRFGLDSSISVPGPYKAVPSCRIHRRIYNSKRYPLYIRPFSLQSSYTPEKKYKLAYLPIIQYIYTTKSSWPEQNVSNSSQIIQWTSMEHITIHFRGSSPIQGTREGYNI